MWFNQTVLIINNKDDLISRLCAPERSWTVTTVAGHRILSPACLPIPPPGQLSSKKIPPPKEEGFLERKTGLEPATPTLARSCSTKWATSANKKNFGVARPNGFVRAAKIGHEPFSKKFWLGYLYCGVYRVLSWTFTSGLSNLLVYNI